LRPKKRSRKIGRFRRPTIALGDKRRFRDALTSAKVELQNAKATVTTGYEGEHDLYTIIEDIMLYAETIRDEMETKIEPRGVERGRIKPSNRPRRG